MNGKDVDCVCMSARSKIRMPLFVIWMDVCVGYFVDEKVPCNCVDDLTNTNSA